MARKSAKINELEGSIKAVLLYMELASGVLVNPIDYAERHGMSRFNVYYYLNVLSRVVDVVNVGRGQWTLLEFVEDENSSKSFKQTAMGGDDVKWAQLDAAERSTAAHRKHAERLVRFRERYAARKASQG